MPALRTLTVAELIDLLRNEDPDSQVVFACSYGDRGRTQQALGIRGDVTEAQIEESGYSESGYAVVDDEDYDEDDDGEGRETVLVLR